MKKYVVYYRYKNMPSGEDCNHNLHEFDQIGEAVEYFNSLKTSDKQILKLVTWKTEITDISE